MSRRIGAVALACACVLLSAVPARAAGVSVTQVRELAARAAGGDATALVELKRVTAVDGQPVQIAAALGNGSAAELRGRLLALAAGPAAPAGLPSAPTISATGARSVAASILSAERFHGAPVPNPTGSALNKLGRLLGRAAAAMIGGPGTFWTVIAAAVLVLALFGARRMMRRLRGTVRSQPAAAESSLEDPASLEQQANDAESHSAFADAVRLRFRAGLLRLSSRRLIDYRPALLTREVGRELASPQFDTLTASFERIAYGGAEAGEADAIAAREGWSNLLKADSR